MEEDKLLLGSESFSYHNSGTDSSAINDYNSCGHIDRNVNLGKVAEEEERDSILEGAKSLRHDSSEGERNSDQSRMSNLAATVTLESAHSHTDSLKSYAGLLFC